MMKLSNQNVSDQHGSLCLELEVGSKAPWDLKSKTHLTMIQTVQHDLASAVQIIGLCSVTILALSDPALRGQVEK